MKDEEEDVTGKRASADGAARDMSHGSQYTLQRERFTAYVRRYRVQAALYFICSSTDGGDVTIKSPWPQMHDCRRKACNVAVAATVSMDSIAS